MVINLIRRKKNFFAPRVSITVTREDLDLALFLRDNHYKPGSSVDYCLIALAVKKKFPEANCFAWTSCRLGEHDNMTRLGFPDAGGIAHTFDRSIMIPGLISSLEKLLPFTFEVRKQYYL